MPLFSMHADQSQRQYLLTTASSLPISNSHATLAKIWHSHRLNNDTTNRIDDKSELSIRCDFSFESRKFHGNQRSRMSKQSLVGGSNAWKEKFLVPAHTRSTAKK